MNFLIDVLKQNSTFKALEKARKFYIKYFGAVSNEMYHNIINNE